MTALARKEDSCTNPAYVLQSKRTQSGTCPSAPVHYNNGMRLRLRDQRTRPGFDGKNEIKFVPPSAPRAYEMRESPKEIIHAPGLDFFLHEVVDHFAAEVVDSLHVRGLHSQLAHFGALLNKRRKATVFLSAHECESACASAERDAFS